MKLHVDPPSGHYIRSFRNGTLQLAERTVNSHVIMTADTLVEWQPRDTSQLELADFEPALAMQPELIVVGTGFEHRFVGSRVAVGIMSRGIGLEVMATDAACRNRACHGPGSAGSGFPQVGKQQHVTY